MSPPVKLKDPMISRIKIMAKLNISEKRVPQDGRIRIRTRLDGKLKEIDFRVSVLPILFVEQPQDDFFTEQCRQDGHAKIDLLPFTVQPHPDSNASVLRNALFRDIQLRHDFDTRDHRVL